MVDRRRIRDQLKASLEAQDPMGVARAVSIPPISPSKKGPEPSSSKLQQPLMVGDVNYGGLASALVDAIVAAEAGYAAKCYQAQASVHSSMNRALSSSEGNWLIPGLVMVCKNTHKIALAADLESTKGGDSNKNSKLQNAVQLLQDSYSKTFNDRTEYQPGAPFDSLGSKKAGVLSIVNELFAMYFRLNILRLCKNLIRPIESRKLHETGTKGQMVTYKYYIGRLNMYEDQHGLAEKNLDYAFQHCHRKALGNQRRILRYLVPVKLYRGRFPTPQFLDKYGLVEFKPLVAGLQKGDLRTFQDGLVKYQDRFIRQGTYLLLEKCKTVCYRNLFKRIHKILDKHQISLGYVALAFNWLGMPIDLDEIECILANLIFRGYVRGYLSHAKRVLVLSKRDPFPTSAVILK